MGENVQLIEQNVQHLTEDVRELKKRMENVEREQSDMKTNQQITNQNMVHVNEKMTDLTASIKTLDDKLDQDREQRKQSEIDQLKHFKTAVSSAAWKVAIALIVAFLAIQLGLKTGG